MRTRAIREVQDGGVYLYRARSGAERRVSVARVPYRRRGGGYPVGLRLEITDCETGWTSYETSATRLFPVIST
jgi:hypothetical protein